MKKNSSAKTPQPAPNGQTPDIQRRINAGWLRLWKAVWPNIPPPVKVQSQIGKELVSKDTAARTQWPDARHPAPDKRRLAEALEGRLAQHTAARQSPKSDRKRTRQQRHRSPHPMARRQTSSAG